VMKTAAATLVDAAQQSLRNRSTKTV